MRYNNFWTASTIVLMGKFSSLWMVIRVEEIVNSSCEKISLNAINEIGFIILLHARYLALISYWAIHVLPL